MLDAAEPRILDPGCLILYEEGERMLDAGCSLLDSGFLILDGRPFGLGAKRFAVMAQAALRKRRVGIGLSCRVTICDFANKVCTYSSPNSAAQFSKK